MTWLHDNSVWILKNNLILCMNFEEQSEKLFSTVAVLLYITTSNIQTSDFSMIFANDF